MPKAWIKFLVIGESSMWHQYFQNDFNTGVGNIFITRRKLLRFPHLEGVFRLILKRHLRLEGCNSASVQEWMLSHNHTYAHPLSPTCQPQNKIAQSEGNAGTVSPSQE